MLNFRKDYVEKLQSDGKLFETDVLAMLLSNAEDGKDCTAVAQALLKRFPSIQAIWNADINEITAVEGVTPRLAAYLKLIGKIAELDQPEQVSLNDSQAFFTFAQNRLAHSKNEYAEIYLLDESNRLIAVRSFTTHQANKVCVSAYDLLALISSSAAHGLYLVHNHVNCAAQPSYSDDKVTLRLLGACEICGVKLLDHGIINDQGKKFSYNQSGRLRKLQSENSQEIEDERKHCLETEARFKG